MAEEILDNEAEGMNEPITLTLTLDDGKELICQVMGTLELEKKDFIAVLPEGEEDFWIYQYKESEDDTLDIDNIDDEDLFERVGHAFEEMFEAEYDEDAAEDEEKTEK